MTKVYHIRIDQKTDARIRQHANKQVPITTAIRMLISAQLDFLDRRSAGAYANHQARPQQPTAPAAEPFEEHVIVYD